MRDVTIIDRRLNPPKGLPNAQRVNRRITEERRKAVRDALRSTPIEDFGKNRVKVKVAKGRLDEPYFHHNRGTGEDSQVLPGNKEFRRGDIIPKPEQGGGGGGGSEGSPDGDGNDDFVWLSRDEVYDIFFEDLELPYMTKLYLLQSITFIRHRAGDTSSGNSLELPRTMRKSLARRIALKRPKPDDVEELKVRLRELEDSGNDPEEVQRLKALIEQLEKRLKWVTFIDPNDLRFKHFEKEPVPNSQAVIFFLMDVSGSMSENMKDLAKRFFKLFHFFLMRNYERVDIVFIRHTSSAKEVTEEEFFGGTETGGTMVSTALSETLRIVEERYPINQWNIYVAQASDGDNYSGDNEQCLVLLEKLLAVTQYFAYVEVADERQAGSYRSPTNASVYWKTCQQFADTSPNGFRFASVAVSSVTDIPKVFQKLFAKKELATR